MTPVTVALVAVVSSLATVGALELLRGSRSGSQRALAVEPRTESAEAPAPREIEPLVSPTRATRALDPPTEYADRLAELERRIAELELGSTSRRAAVDSATDEPPAGDDLRELVLDWVAEEREARWRAAELEEEEGRRTELEFETRFSAHMLAEEHDLLAWQEAKLAEVFLEIETRRREIDESFDLTVDDPREVEARYDEFDEWAEERLREGLGPELFEVIHGEEEDYED